jgi:hypothetical protein
LTSPLCTSIQKDSNELCFIFFLVLDNFLWILNRNLFLEKELPIDLHHASGYMDQAARDQQCFTRNTAVAHYAAWKRPGADGPSGPLGPANTHRCSAAETGDVAARGGISHCWAFWLTGDDVVRPRRESGTLQTRWGGPRVPSLTLGGRR